MLVPIVMDMTIQKKVFALFNNNDMLSTLTEAIRQGSEPFWLVGGCLRDLLLERPITDLDIISSTDPTSFAKKWSSQIDGRWFWLDSERLQSRVLLNDSIHVDFSPFRAETLLKDLELRDFTINSMALRIPVDDKSPLVDPLDGLNDLQKKQLRVSSAQSCSDDPLRMMKGIRHAITLDLKLVPETFNSIKALAKRLPDVPGERIREELLQILLSEDPIRGIDLLYDTGLLDTLIESHAKVKNWSLVLDQLRSLSKRLIALNHACETRQRECGRTGGFPNKALFLLVKLLEYYPPDNLPRLLHTTLRMSRREQRIVEQLLSEKHNEKKMCDMFQHSMGDRQTALIVERLEPFPIEKILYRGVCHDQFDISQALAIYENYLHEQRQGRIPDLLSGNELKEMINPVNGPHLGAWQEKIKQAEIDGIISTRRDAEEWLKEQITD